MAQPREIISIGDLLLSTIGASGWVTEESDNPILDADYVQRTDAAPTFVASTVAPLNVALVITGLDAYSDKLAVMRALNYPRTDQPIPVQAYVGDPSSPVAASIDVSLSDFRIAPNSVTANVVSAGGLWKAVTATTLGPYTFTTDGALPLVSDGQAVTHPTVKVGWSVQRTTDSATVGWKYRKQVTITNNGTRDWHDRPVVVDLGDTAALVSGSKAQADGDDLRVRIEGAEKYRTLVNWNTARSFVWFLVTIKAGGSVTADIVYGNPSATTPRNLSTRTATRDTYVAFDLEGDSGTATAGAGSTITNSGESWETNRWTGGYIQILSGTGSGQRRRIASNTGTVITVARNWTTNPDNTSVYVVWRSGVEIDGGAASAGTTTSLTDASQSWSTNEWAGGALYNVTKGIGPFTITSNTATVLTTGTMTAPAASDVYYIERYGAHIYNVNPAVYNATHLDLWRRNTYYTKPSRIWYGNQVPGGWTPTLYLDNGDDFAQSRVYDIGSGGGHNENWRAGLRARRSRSQDNTYPEEGQADGVSVYAPEGYQGIRYDYQLKNEGGVGKFVLSVLDPGGEDWRDVTTNSTTYANLAAGTISTSYRDLSTDENPTRIYMGVLPADGVAIPTTVAITEEIEARTYERLELFLDLTDIGGLVGGKFSAGSEEAIYDLNAVLRIGGGTDGDEPPWDQVSIGGTDHHVHLLSTEELWITTDESENRPVAGVYVASTGALSYAAPWAIRAYHYETDTEGTAQPLVARTILPVSPKTNLIPNPTFATDLTGWELDATSGGVTVNWVRDAAVYFDAAGSLSAVVSAAPGSAWATTYRNTTYLEPVIGQPYTISFAVRATSALYSVAFSIMEYDSGQSLQGTVSYLTDIPDADTWFVHAFRYQNDDPTRPYIRVKVHVVEDAATTGTVYFDQLTMGLSALFVDETAMGELTVEVEFHDRYVA